MKKRLWLVLALLLALCAGAFGQPLVPQNSISNTEQGFRTWFFDGGYKVGSGPAAGPAGRPMVNTPYNPQNLSGWTTAGNYGVSPAATGPTINTSAGWPSPNGKTVDIKVAAPIVPRAVGKLLTLGLKLLPWVGTGYEIYDAVKELGFSPSRNADGSIGYAKIDTTVCSVAPCTGYQVQDGPVSSTPIAACQAYVNWKSAIYHAPYLVAAYTCGAYINSNNYTTSWGINSLSVPPSPEASTPSSEQEFIDAVAARSGWPSSANLAKAISQSLAAPAPAGTPAPSLDVGTPTVTGPATSPGPSTTTNNPDGSRTVSTDTYNYTYNGDKITNNVTNNTTTYNTDNSVRSVSTSSKAADKPVDPCTESPDTVGCQKLGDAPTIEKIPTQEIPVTSTPVSFGSASGCPTPYSGTIHVLSFTKSWSITFDPMCDLMNTLRPLFLALGAAAAAWLFMEGLQA